MLIVKPVAAVAGGYSAACFDSATSRRLSHSVSFVIPRVKFGGLTDNCAGRRTGKGRIGIKATANDQSISSSGPLKQNVNRSEYHPYEDISDSELTENEKAQLTPAEISRTIVEVNSKATLMFSRVISNEMRGDVFLPDVPYVTDDLGNIYFQVKNEEDVLQSLTAEENIVQVIIGLDAAELLSEIESSGQSEIDDLLDEFDEEFRDIDDDDLDEDEDEDDDDDDDDDDEGDWVSILDDEEDTDEDSEGSLGDWAKLETMRSSHPTDFAKSIAEVVTDDPIDFMDLPPAGLAIHGLLRPAFLEEYTSIQKQLSEHKSNDGGINQMETVVEHKQNGSVQIIGHKHESGSSQDNPSSGQELEKDETVGNGTSFYKLEMIKIHILSSHGYQTFVEFEDFKRARPDAIAHSAPKIISRLKSVGEKTTEAFRSLCWRCKGIQVEEVALIGIDSLGFDLRVCSGIQVQTLRFSFKKRSSSENSAETQLNNLLFPKVPT